jgi:hypothetical protein
MTIILCLSLLIVPSNKLISSGLFLAENCKYFSIDRFILTTRRYRGQWTPSSLESFFWQSKQRPQVLRVVKLFWGLRIGRVDIHSV